MRDVHSIVVYAEIEGYPGYFAGTDGNIVSWLGKSPRVLKGAKDKDGYMQVGLCCNKNRTTKKVHRLVLQAFVGDCPEGMEACHDNDIPNDNRLANLRWDYHKANAQDRINNGCVVAGELNPMAELTEEKVRQLRLDRQSGMTFFQLSDKYGVSFQHASLIVKRKRWAHVE